MLEEAARDNSEISSHGVLGYCYYQGIGFKRDTEKAIAHFQNGCDAGDHTAIYAMGAVHSDAGGLDKEAAFLFKKAASMRSTDGMVGLEL